ncbi:MAG: YtxH domain-containing protein [Ignavibacteriales bacterium]|nr:YtxH domain-containing protein [Ignavibacteriales bacterium]
MSSDDDNGMTKGLLVGLIAGGVIGAVIALLYAPKPGKELRADIKNKAGELIDDAEEAVAVAKTKAVEIINEGKKRSESLITEAKKRAESLLGDAEKILTDAKERVETEETRVKSAVKAGAEAWKSEKNRS